jgi:hypothetical protein
MVFFTSIIIVGIVYYLQADGLIYVTIIAVIGELVNIFLNQTLSKSIEKKSATKFGKIIHSLKTNITIQKKTIKELEKIQEDSVLKLMSANKKIEDYEEKLGIGEAETQAIEIEIASTSQIAKKAAKMATDKKNESKNPKDEKPEKFVDLPSGSNRKQIPISNH